MRPLVIALSLALACAHATVAPPPLNPLPSRQRESAPGGFFLQPPGLADDYPEGSDPVAKMRRDIRVMHEAGITYLRFAIG
jgi:hypothetical protein